MAQHTDSTIPTTSGVLVGYARVSTGHQTTDQQLDALREYGVPLDRIYSDTMSGARTDRPGLAAALDYLRAGDTLVVVAIDRLGRSLSHVLQTIEDLQRRGINLISIREALDLSTPTGRFQGALFAALAELERELIRERAAAAREAAAARGRQIGRPRGISDAQVLAAQSMRASGMSVTAIAAALGCPRASIYRYGSAFDSPATDVRVADEAKGCDK